MHKLARQMGAGARRDGCGCGTATDRPRDRLACLECGAPCCAECAVPLESVTYCRGCATELLGTALVRAAHRFDLH